MSFTRDSFEGSEHKMVRPAYVPPRGIRIVFDGQSMNNTPAAPQNMPTYVMATRPYPWTASPAIGGAGWYDLSRTDSPTFNPNTRLYPQARTRPGCTDILVMTGGQGDTLNDSPSGQQTGAVAYARAVAYADAARAAGFDKIIMSTSPAMGPNMLGTGRPTTFEATSRADYNALVLANSGGFDAVADISVAPLDDATNLTYFAIDRLHWSPAGAQAAAAIIGPVIDSVIASL